MGIFQPKKGGNSRWGNLGKNRNVKDKDKRAVSEDHTLQMGAIILVLMARKLE